MSRIRKSATTSAPVRAAVRRVAAAGAHVVIATGRSMLGTLPVLDDGRADEGALGDGRPDQGPLDQGPLDQGPLDATAPIDLTDPAGRATGSSVVRPRRRDR